ncbi:DMT family transporter [Sphingomonas piscis]|uniref:DMT family transporter n=2 Tax=Sphingomonas piscis TaxID=2714943 RepID=A0A6G7YTF1_9SPHN|nr:DMT family transporter [Sphingomonas piscis]
MSGIALFSGMDAVMKGLVLAIGTFATMFWRNLIGIGLSGSFYLRPGMPAPSASTLRLHIARGVLSTLMGFLFFWALGRVPLAQAIALSFIAPLIALFLAAALLHEEVGRRTVIASLAAFAGVVVIFVGQARADLGREALLGSLAVLGSAVCYAVNIIMMRKQSLVASPAEAAFFQATVVTATLACFIPIAGIAVPPLNQWPWLVLAAILAVASSSLLTWAYARAEASYLAATEYTAFLWASLFGWLIYREAVSLFTVAGAALIVGGCIAGARRPGESAPRLEAAI